MVSVCGVYATLHMDVDVLPNINKPTVAVFAEADADKSKTLSLNEFATFIKLFEATHAERHFKCLDTNGDGQVSSDELAAHRPPHGPHHPPPF